MLGLARTARCEFGQRHNAYSGLRLEAEWLAAMKKGQNLFVQAIQVNGSPVTLPLGLVEFAKAYDGPPSDPQIFEENQLKLEQ